MLEFVSITIDSFGFLVKPSTILKGEVSVIERLKSSRDFNPLLEEVTDEEFLQGTTLLMSTPNIIDWAKIKTQYEDQ